LGGVSATYQYQAGGTTVTGVNRPLSAVAGSPAGGMVIEGSLSRDAAGLKQDEVAVSSALLFVLRECVRGGRRLGWFLGRASG
jgi:hypothetical protein